MNPFEEWAVTSQTGYLLKAYSYCPVTFIRRILFGKDETPKAYFRNCWGMLPQEILSVCRRHPVIWIEAQSLGEVGQIVTLCGALREAFPEDRLLLSTHDTASLELAARRLPLAGAFYSPWDIPWVCRRVLRQIRPRLLLYVEHVKSPVLLEEAHRFGARTFLVSGFFPPGWERNSYLRRPVAQRFWEYLDLAAVKEEEDRQTLIGFGMSPQRISVQGDLKFDAALGSLAEENKQRFKREFGIGGEPLFISGSLHRHEVSFVAEAFLMARRSIPTLKWILAPRWIEEVPLMESVLSQYPVSVRRRSTLSSTSQAWKDVLVLDTYGELAPLYSLATVVFMGGSLPEQSGAWAGLCHNMIEPLLHAKPIFFGTNTHYRRRLVERLKQVWPGLEVTTAQQLGEGIAALVQDSDLCSRIEAQAREIVAEQEGIVPRYAALLGGLLNGSPSALVKPDVLKKRELAEVRS